MKEEEEKKMKEIQEVDKLGWKRGFSSITYSDRREALLKMQSFQPGGRFKDAEFLASAMRQIAWDAEEATKETDKAILKMISS